MNDRDEHSDDGSIVQEGGDESDWNHDTKLCFPKPARLAEDNAEDGDKNRGALDTLRDDKQDGDGHDAGVGEALDGGGRVDYLEDEHDGETEKHGDGGGGGIGDEQGEDADEDGKGDPGIPGNGVKGEDAQHGEADGDDDEEEKDAPVLLEEAKGDATEGAEDAMLLAEVGEFGTILGGTGEERIVDAGAGARVGEWGRDWGVGRGVGEGLGEAGGGGRGDGGFGGVLGRGGEGEGTDGFRVCGDADDLKI